MDAVGGLLPIAEEGTVGAPSSVPSDPLTQSQPNLPLHSLEELEPTEDHEVHSS